VELLTEKPEQEKSKDEQVKELLELAHSGEKTARDTMVKGKIWDWSGSIVAQICKTRGI